MTGPVLQDRLPVAAWTAVATRRLPGVQPLSGAPWLMRDDAFAGQMALRDRLLLDSQDLVMDALPGTEAGLAEVLDAVVTHLRTDVGYTVRQGAVTRPDGVSVPLDGGRPLLTLGRLVQEDLCLLHPFEDGHRLVAAVLCFPAGWTLAQKMGRPMLAIHDPVPSYGEGLNTRVERMMSALRPGAGIWRANALAYHAPDLHTPRREGDPRPHRPGPAPYIRAERQCLLRMPKCGGVLFTIHTYVVRRESLTHDQAAALEAYPIEPKGL